VATGTVGNASHLHLASRFMARRIVELARLFLKLGTVSFGGPAAHFAMMEHEVVQRRNWVSRQQFLDLIGVTHLIPGPNAVEMAGHIGYRRAGLVGSVTGALCFTLPAVAITAVFAWSYVRYGTLPQVEPFLHGIKPAMLAVIFTAAWRLGKKALAGWQLGLIGASVAAAVLAGCDEVLTLLGAGVIGLVFLRVSRRGSDPASPMAAGALAGTVAGGAAGTARASAAGTTSATAAAGAGIGAAGVAAGAAAPAAVSLWKLGLFFAKVGAVMYGGGYVLIAYLEGGLVGQYPGFGQQQLLDAVAIGQLTPGPMLTTATFVGYLVAGVSGAVVATVGIMLPCFLLVAAVNPLIPRLRSSRWASLFLDAVNAASVGLIAAVTITLSRHTLVDWQSCLLALTAAIVLLCWKVSPVWLVLGGAVVGWILW
jgi:chromate transporter